MKENKITCDKCGAVEVTTLSRPEGWFILLYEVSRNDYRYSTKVQKDLCGKCCKELGINLRVNEDKRNEDIGERLVEILSEIVGEVSNG